jgi:hypothetical protein
MEKQLVKRLDQLFRIVRERIQEERSIDVPVGRFGGGGNV